MKRVLVVVCVGLTIMAVSMMSGCAGQKPVDDAAYKGFFLTGNEGAAKEPIKLGEAVYTGSNVGGNEGSTRPGVSLGEAVYTGSTVGGNEGSTRPGIK